MSKPFGIYVPGLSDHRSWSQEKALKHWRVADFEYFPMGWANDESFSRKLSRLIKRIDDLYQKSGRPIVLMGASAGASAVLNAYVQRKDKVACVVVICGKIQRPGAIGDGYFRKNPSFKESVFSLQDSLKQLDKKDKAKILSVRAAIDGLIPARDTKISGVRNMVMPVISHLLGIAFALTLYKGRISRFIKRCLS